MSRTIRKQIFETLETLQKATELTGKLLREKQAEQLPELLAGCQECAIAIGTRVEENYTAELQSIRALEEYCELVYQMSEALEQPEACVKLYQQMENQVQQVRTKMKEELPDKLEVVFLPYKVSMWDSLESIWMAADADQNCDAYVIPIPYYDKNPDGSFKQEHYEGDMYPDCIPVTDYRGYDFAKRRPDAVFIHNPYDQFNNVTSIHPFFYSKNLKQFTDMLVYVPYYSTAGGMSEGQKSCMAYYFADYLVIQAEKYRKFFDPQLPQEKLLALGSPKFDRVLRLCQNPPEPPEDWKEKMAGKKVYFYNTSLNGMLANTASFLEKMAYVFRCFEKNKAACLLWRPHPLMDSTFATMRAEYKPVYDMLKKKYQEGNWGIYDDTPEIANTIALCDAYVGDAGTSVTSLFGLAGKPMFILNNEIHSEPKEDDWRGEMVRGFSIWGDEWIVAPNNKLYRSRNRDYKYEYFCDLNTYSGGAYYSAVLPVNGKNYVCPASAQDILLLGEHGIEKRIQLKYRIEQRGAFCSAAPCGKYLFLIPNNYPAIVRYNTETEELVYLTEHLDVPIGTAQGERRIGACCAQDEFLYWASPIDNRMLKINAETCKMQVLAVGPTSENGCAGLIPNGEDLWLLPMTGRVITRWNPKNGDIKKYTAPDSLECRHPVIGYVCENRPFGYAVFDGDDVYLPPSWGNLYLKLNQKTGEMTEWEPPFEQPKHAKNGYYMKGGKCYFYRPEGQTEGPLVHAFSLMDSKLYELNLRTKEYQKIEVKFSREELQSHEAGFGEYSEWMRYACLENAFNSLSDFLNDNITGGAFDAERQIRAFGEIASNHDGTSGDKIYEFVQKKLQG